MSTHTFANTAIYSLPEELDTHLSEIPTCCFYSCVNLAAVMFSTLSKINASAFRNCINIQSVSLENVKLLSYLASDAFGSCSNITTINLPNITTLRSFVFNIGTYNYPMSEQTSYQVFTGAKISTINAAKCSQFGSYIFANITSTIETLNLQNCTSF